MVGEPGRSALLAWMLLAVAAAALVVHFAAPHAVVDYSGAEEQGFEPSEDDRTLTRAEAQDAYDIRSFKPAIAAPDAALAGLALLAIGALVLAGVSTEAIGARHRPWNAYLGAALAFLGSAIAAASSFLWMGLGLSDRLNTLFFQDGPAVSIYIVAPTVVGLLAAVAAYLSLRISRELLPAPEDVLPGTRRARITVVAGIGLLAASALVPWAMVERPDVANSDDASDWGFVSGLEMASENAVFRQLDQIFFFDDPPELDEDPWAGATYSLNVLYTAGWTATVVGLIAMAGLVPGARGAVAPVPLVARYGPLVVALATGWALIMYTLLWLVYFEPGSHYEEAGFDARPGILPILVLPIIGYLGWTSIQGVREGLPAAAKTSHDATTE